MHAEVRRRDEFLPNNTNDNSTLSSSASKDRECKLEGRFSDFKDFTGRRPLPVKNCVVSIGDGLEMLNKLSKVWRVNVWQNYNEKTSLHLQLFIGLIPSHYK